MNIGFSDGTNTNWSATDQDGQQLNNDATQQSWHYRRVDLSSYAGKSISNIYLVQESTTAAGNWDIYFTDIAIVSTDGTVRPLYNRQKTISLSASGTSGVTGRMYEISHLSNELQYPDQTTTFYHGDHLGSARLLSSVNGYPVWQATYLPFGYEKNPQSSLNAYKFTGYERDSESGLDYANQRYYFSIIGRFMTADPLGASADLADPQSWNRYAYVVGNPANLIDPIGLTCVIPEKGDPRSWPKCGNNRGAASVISAYSPFQILSFAYSDVKVNETGYNYLIYPHIGALNALSTEVVPDRTPRPSKTVSAYKPTILQRINDWWSTFEMNHGDFLNAFACVVAPDAVNAIAEIKPPSGAVGPKQSPQDGTGGGSPSGLASAAIWLNNSNSSRTQHSLSVTPAGAVAANGAATSLDYVNSVVPCLKRQ